MGGPLKFPCDLFVKSQANVVKVSTKKISTHVNGCETVVCMFVKGLHLEANAKHMQLSWCTLAAYVNLVLSVQFAGWYSM